MKCDAKFVSSIFLVLFVSSSSATSEIIPLSVYEHQYPWKAAVKECWTRLGVRLASSKFSLDHLKEVQGTTKVWTGIFRRGSKNDQWINQDGDIGTAGVNWCEKPEDGNKCVAWVKDGGTDGSPCLRAENCSTELIFACEGVKIDFDSQASKNQEKQFEQWCITTGVLDKDSQLTLGPVGDHTLFIGTNSSNKCEEKDKSIRPYHINKNDKLIKCLPWTVRKTNVGTLNSVAKKKAAGNSCINPNGATKGAWCYCRYLDTNGECSADATVGKGKKTSFDYCKTACEGKFAHLIAAQSNVTIKSTLNSHLYFYYQITKVDADNKIEIGSDSISTPTTQKWKKFERQSTGNTQTLTLKVKSTDARISIDDLSVLQIEKDNKNCLGGKFGKGCKKTCNCKDGDSCNVFSGVCDGDCKYGTYGPDCQENATCNITVNEFTVSNCTEPMVISGTVCNIKCQKGFYRKGGQNRNCIQEKSGVSEAGRWETDWAETDFTCHKIKCDDTVPQKTTKPLKNCTNFNQTCEFECKEGYWNLTKLSPICEQHINQESDWENEKGAVSYPECEDVDCGKNLPKIPDADPTTCEESKWKNNCTMNCMPGFYRTGTCGTFECQQTRINENAKWAKISGEFSCQKVSCELPSIINITVENNAGSIACNNTVIQHGTNCQLTCNSGYEFSSNLISSAITCQQKVKNGKATDWKSWMEFEGEKCIGNKTGFCKDVDECKINKEICQHKNTCANKCGDYKCACNPTYIGKNCSNLTPNLEFDPKLDSNYEKECSQDKRCEIPLVKWPSNGLEMKLEIKVWALELKENSLKQSSLILKASALSSDYKNDESQSILLMVINKHNKDSKLVIENGKVISGTNNKDVLKPYTRYKISFDLSTTINEFSDKIKAAASFILKNDASPPPAQYPLIIGIISGILVLVAIVAVIITVHKKRRSTSHRKASDSVQYSQTNGGEINGAYLGNHAGDAFGRSSSDTSSNSNPEKPLLKQKSTKIKAEVAVVAPQPRIPRGRQGQPRTPGGNCIPVAQLMDLVLNQRNTVGHYRKEYESIPDKLIYSHEMSSRPENKTKNRFQDILAYDHSRVILKTEKDEEEVLYANMESSKDAAATEESDYINANYVHGYVQEKGFIASQGPKRGTVVDFWKMVWQENAKVIVMLTNLVEEGKKKCEQYWPDELGKNIIHAEVKVTLVNEYSFADYTVRDLDVTGPTQSGSVRSRGIKLYHFTSWPDQGVPRSPIGMSSFIQILRLKHAEEQRPNACHSPTVVHCSAGIGRTGTLIALWNLLDEVDATQHINVLDTVRHMREFRFKLVQTEDQYKFIYDTLALACNAMLQPVQLHELNRFHDENLSHEFLEELFDNLGKFSHQIPVNNISTMDDNMKKNRFREGPFVEDNMLVYLYTYMPQDNSSYINGGFINTYSTKNGCIVTQAPLSNTVKDFWALVWDQKVESIVMLNEGQMLNDTGPDYWPPTSIGTKVSLGMMDVEIESRNRESQVTTRTLKVSPSGALGNEEPPLVVTQFQMESWPDDASVPPKPEQLYQLIQEVMRHQRQRGNPKLLIHCMDACQKTGLFATILNILERIDAEKLVHVPWAILSARETQREFIVDQEQLRLCYTIAKMHQNDNDVYANFQ